MGSSHLQVKQPFLERANFCLRRRNRAEEKSADVSFADGAKVLLSINHVVGSPF